MMKKLLFYILPAFLVVALIYSCDKGTFDPQGGELQTNFIVIRKDSISPPVITVRSGSSITFLNQDAISHNIISTDSITIITNDIAPNKSYIWKKDTFGTFPYYDRLNPALNGIIVITR